MNDFIERHGGGKVFWWLFGALATVLILCIVIHGRIATASVVGGATLRLTKVSEEGVVMTDGAGNEAVMTGAADLHVSGGAHEYHYLDRQMSCVVDWPQSGDYIYTFSNGTQKNVSQMILGFGGSANDGFATSALQREEYALMQKMQNYMRDGNPLRHYIWQGLLGLLLLALGAAMVCFPRAVWQLNTMFTVIGGEPTDWALFGNRAAGFMLIAMAFAVPFMQ